MRKFLLILGGLSASLYNAQQITPKVGINTNAPTEVLDVNGTGRYRNLSDANGQNGYSRVVVSKEDGTLGYKTPEKSLILKKEHATTGLSWNTRGYLDGNPPTEQVWNLSHPSNLGKQDNFKYYMIFGTRHDIPSKPTDTPENPTVVSGGFTDTQTTFSAKEGDVLNINTLISYMIVENFIGTRTSYPLKTKSANGDRQVVMYLYLYKGNEMLRKVRQVVNFNGGNDKTTGTNVYDGIFSRSIGLVYPVPSGGTGADYSVSLAITVRAPLDGNFRIMLDSSQSNPVFSNDLFQYLTISK